MINEMKIVISSTGDKLESQISPVFGRCAYFIIAEIKDKNIESVQSIENTAANQAGGAGITASQIVANEKVDAVVTGAMGPRAFSVLEQFKTDVFNGEQGTVKENAEKFIQGKLKKLTAPGPMGIAKGFGRGFGQGQGRGRRSQR